MLLEYPMFLVIIPVWERLVDVYGAGRAGRPFTDEEVLYRKGGDEPIIPSRKSSSFCHDGGRNRRREGDDPEVLI
jgi:hypothetical protein